MRESRTFIGAGRRLAYPGLVLATLWLIAIAVLSSPVTVHGQEPTFRREVSSIPVSQEGEAIPEPWTGGLRSPRPQLVDLDGDQDLDLLIVQGGGGITYYRNEGGVDGFLYRFVEDNVQDINAGTWATLADIDDDGDLDLFVDGDGSVAFYRNQGTANTPLWQLEDPTFQGIVNSGSGNTPSFVDVDDDGDLDYLEMEQSFGTARLYRNAGTRQSPSYEFVTNTWGCIDTFDPGFAGIVRGDGDGTPDGSGKKVTTGRNRHGISVIAPSDIDADGDLDIFIGDLNNENLWYFRNDPAPEICYTKVTKDYMPINTPGLNHAVLGDLDNDDDLDMLVGVAMQNAGRDNLILLENLGTAQSASHAVTTTNLIPAIDVGGGSRVATGDLDGDGDPDLYLGSDDGIIVKLIDVGTPASPSYEISGLLQNSDLIDIDVGFWSAPEFVDYEGDGDLDLFIGTGAGRINFYRNDGDAQVPVLRLVEAEFTGVRADFNAVPSLGDLDEDGDLDVLVGEFGVTANPRLFYMRNDGTTESPVWAQASDNTSSTFIFAERVFDGDLAPKLFDLDGDGDLDLFVGETDGNINYYRNDGTTTNFQFVLVNEAFAAAQIGRNAGPCFVDLDGDSDADLLVGEENGGVNLFRNLTLSAVSLVRFEARVRNGWVELLWETGRESNHLGFHVYRAPDIGGGAGAFARLNKLLLTGPSPYHLDDRTVLPGNSYFYRLEDVDRLGHSTIHPPVAVTVAKVLPATPVLRRISPLPARGGTTVSFALPGPGHVELRIHDASGRLVRRLLDRHLATGEQQVGWDGRDDRGQRVPAAVYFVVLETSAGITSARMVALP